MTDPYSGISDPQTDRILEEMEYRNGSKRGENYSTIMRDRNKKEETYRLEPYRPWYGPRSKKEDGCEKQRGICKNPEIYVGRENISQARIPGRLAVADYRHHGPLRKNGQEK